MIDPNEHPWAYDHVLFDGQATPGIAVVTNCARPYKRDKKQGQGTNGDTVAFRGTGLVEPTVTLTMTNADQLETWYALARDVFKIDPTKKTFRAIDVVHPLINEADVKAVTPKSYPVPEDQGGGKWTVTIELEEFAPPPKAKSSGTAKGGKGASGGSGGSGAGKKPEDALSEQEKEIARLSKLASDPYGKTTPDVVAG